MIRFLVLTSLIATSSPAASLQEQLPSKILDNEEIRNLLSDQKPVESKVRKKRRRRLRRLDSFKASKLKLADSTQTPMIFDLPVTYNPRVRHWISYFQGSGRKWFRRWLERSHRYTPLIQKILVKKKRIRNITNCLVVFRKRWL